jgi:ribosomal protein L24
MLRDHTQSSVKDPNAAVFHKGDEVVLARGSNRGTRGQFLGLREDPKWADILEANSQVREHPVEWLEHVETRKPN